MSRHTIPGHHPGLVITVGWDNPLRTYFAVVEQEPLEAMPEDDPEPVLWVGATPGEITCLQVLALHLEPYATLTAAQRASLAADRAVETRRQPTPAQRMMTFRGERGF